MEYATDGEQQGKVAGINESEKAVKDVDFGEIRTSGSTHKVFVVVCG